jgi:GcrA cell cycle regulator
MVWDDDTISNLRDLWMQGLSTAEIGRRLGVSKNAIVGKAHRLELDARPSPIRRSVAKPPEEQPTGYSRSAGPTLPPLASAEIHNLMLSAVQPGYPKPTLPFGEGGSAAAKPELRVAGDRPLRPTAMIGSRTAVTMPTVAPAPRTVMQASTIQARRSAPSCCWPIGEPGTKTFRFCDDVSVPGKPYCDDHAKLAYVKIRDRKDDAA